MPALSKSAAFAALLPPWPHDVLPANAVAASASGQTLVVLDDDPTGTQTVRAIAVVTTWDVATLTAELAAAPACFYVLTNSRSLTAEASHALHLELATHLRSASRAAGRPFVIASRSDSTLRGYYPLETDTLSSVLGPFDATLLTPYFEAGGRYTLNDTHYVAEGDRLVPAADTPFARDAAFGYRHSHLPSWVEEKTAGRDTVVYTSRQLITSSDAAASLAIGRRVSEALVLLIRNLTIAPRYLIAKGGITSSDTATLGLGVRRALVLGQALPGVPVWQLGPESKFPGLGYVVFPGNVGSDTALAELIARLHRS